MLLDRETLDLLPRAAEVVDAARDDRASSSSCRRRSSSSACRRRALSREAIAALAPRGATSPPPRRRVGRLAAAGVHPFAAPIGLLNDGRALRADRARVRVDRAAPARLRAAGARRGRRRRPLAGGLQRAAPVAAAESPRSPPTRRSTTAATPGWPRSGRRSPSSCRARGSRRRSRRGRRSPRRSRGAPPPARVPDARRWWWELRPHPAFGTLELRVPDAQATVADAAAVTALVHALAGWLAARHDAGEPLAVADTWRIEENRWSAARSGIDAELADLSTGERVPARERLAELVVRARAGRRASSAARRSWRRSSGSPPIAAPRASARSPSAGGPRAVAEWLADVYALARVRGSPGHRTGRRRSPERRRTAANADAARAPAARSRPRLLRSRPAPARRRAPALREPTMPPTRARRRSPTRTSSSRSTSATSCTTAACRASTSAGSGRRRCWRCARRWSALRGRPARGGRTGRPAPPPEEFDVALRAIAAADDAPSLSRFVERDGDARRRCSSSSCTAPPTSSRRPTRTRGRSRA